MTEVNVMPTALPNSRNISNSEVTAWLACRQMYYFAFMLNLAPKITPMALARGTLGHEAFSRYIQARLNGESHEGSLVEAAKIFPEYAQNGISIDIVMNTKLLFDRYMEAHNGWPEWELLGTEERLDLRITDTLSIPIRYDLMIREKSSGKIKVGDFKFTYDFWKPIEHDTNVQMPKYIQVMRKNGIEVHGGFLEEIRSRPLGKEKTADHRNLWRRTNYNPSGIRLHNAIKQHVQASLEIEEYRNLNESEQEMKTIPVFNKHGACKYCNFIQLCNSKLDGKSDLSFDIAQDFVENTYGYNKTINELTIEELI